MTRIDVLMQEFQRIAAEDAHRAGMVAVSADQWGALRDRVAALEAALGTLVAVAPTYDDEGVGTRCCYCGGRRTYTTPTTAHIAHKDTCPWLVARNLVGGTDGR